MPWVRDALSACCWRTVSYIFHVQELVVPVQEIRVVLLHVLHQELKESSAVVGGLDLTEPGERFHLEAAGFAAVSARVDGVSQAQH